jgi:plasmid stabilization system protein ParE
MAIPRVVYSPEARDDLLAIETHTAISYGEAQVQQTIGLLKGIILHLSYMPGMGKPPRFNIRTGAFAFPVSVFCIIYEPLSEFDGIRVVRVLDGRRDLPHHLGAKA